MGMNPNEMLEKLPDFDTMNDTAEANARAKANLEKAKNRLELEIARCIREAMTNSRYWVNNKPPSMSYANAVIAQVGNTPEDAETLERLREQVSNYTETYQATKQLLSNMETQIAMWQTHSANRRKTTV